MLRDSRFQQLLSQPEGVEVAGCDSALLADGREVAPSFYQCVRRRRDNIKATLNAMGFAAVQPDSVGKIAYQVNSSSPLGL